MIIFKKPCFKLCVQYYSLLVKISALEEKKRTMKFLQMENAVVLQDIVKSAMSNAKEMVSKISMKR